MKRQRSRNRGGGGGGGGSGGGGNKPTHNVNRAFDSNGPEGVKIRGHAQHVFEKYQQLARDAQGAGDRVLAENHLQHAEHYFRLIRAVTPSRPASDIIGRDAFTSGIDIDFEDESGGQAAIAAAADAAAAAAAETAEAAESEGAAEPRADQPRSDQQRSDRGDYQRSDRSDSRDRYEGGRRDYRDNRSEGNRSDSSRSEGNRSEGGRSEGGRSEGGRQESARSEGRSDYRDNRSDASRSSEPRSAERPDYRGDNRSEGQRSERTREDRPRDERPRSERYSRDRYESRSERGGADPLAVVEPQATPLVQPEPAAPKPARSRSRSSAPRADAPAEGSTRVLRSHDGDVSHAPAFLQQRTELPATEPAAPAAPKRRGRPPRATVTEPAEEA